MEQEHQQRYYELGKTYWWLAGKYRIIQDVVARTVRGSARGRRVLDLGCGPGNLLDFLVPHGDTYGSDFSADALRFCTGRGYRRLFRADFQRLPLKSSSFDLVTCIDVLEHIEDDRRAVAELQRILRPGGILVVSVPAFQALWGDHDALYGHYRRYRTEQVRERLEAAGLRMLKLTYFEPLFFLPLWLYRNVKKLVLRKGGIQERDDFVKLPAAVNTVLTHLIAAERYPLRHVSFPFGVTLLAVAEKPGWFQEGGTS
jgi:SAM-dependent methyltransferase